MEKLVNKLSGGLEVNVTKEVEGHKSDNERPPASGSRADNLNPIPITPPTTVGLATPRTVDSTPQSDEEDVEFSEELTDGMQQLSIGSQPSRYHGKSSGLVFMRSAIALKDEHAGPSRPEPQTDESHPWLDAFVEDDFPLLDEHNFPAQDLLNALVDLYFRHINCHLPLLHEPTFKSAIEAGEHLRNGGFGATVLLVCANGSRFARADPYKARRLSFAPAKLHDLQVYVLTALFLQGTAAPHTTWAVIGAGIRAAVDVGAHRKKVYTSTPTVEEELWRRAVW
ncbi:transcription factor [Ganoderma sinense ZZ0214-1]|uniref:Transcription factor n=1 Tax=Ganoderma sinense ZZ0214-1 TaxID=1077348 RepID=A0A2G8RV94_9APHY|nr:transcription factor [Ganoderma sinense ZZ0214-1]